MALVEIAYEIFSEHKKPITFQELTDQVASLLGMGKEELEDRIAQFYTDLNIDGRFLALSDQTWGLRSWYPYDQLDEETQPTVKAKKKKRKKRLKKILILTNSKKSTRMIFFLTMSKKIWTLTPMNSMKSMKPTMMSWMILKTRSWMMMKILMKRKTKSNCLLNGIHV